MKVAVIGAGITGVTTAAALQERGCAVTVFDRNRYAAMETSFANGGQLSASNAEVWTRWSTVLKGLSWMFSPSAPLLVNPRPSWRKLSWMAEFVSNIPSYRRNTVETVRLAIASRRRLAEIAERYGVAFDCERRGILHVYASAAELAHAREVNALLREGGLERREVSPSEIRALEPTIEGPLVGGFFTESDFTGDIHAFSTQLLEALVARGLDTRFGAEITHATPRAEGGAALTWRAADAAAEAGAAAEEVEAFDAVVVCAGVASRRIAAELGDRVNIYPVKGYSITVRLDDADSQAAAPWVSLLDDEAKVVTSRLGADRLRIAGTAEFNGENLDIRADRIKPLVRWCERLFPAVRTEHAIPWAGLRPMTPSMLPKVGPGRRPGVVYNTGHGHLGWTLSAATADLAAEAVAPS